MVDDRQVRIVRRMLSALRASRAGSISYERLAGDLAAHFLAGEFKDEAFRSRFYELWAPLEQAWDTRAGDPHEPLMKACAAALEAFLAQAVEGLDRSL
jgi:hypothetical protein